MRKTGTLEKNCQPQSGYLREFLFLHIYFYFFANAPSAATYDPQKYYFHEFTHRGEMLWVQVGELREGGRCGQGLGDHLAQGLWEGLSTQKKGETIVLPWYHNFPRQSNFIHCSFCSVRTWIILKCVTPGSASDLYLWRHLCHTMTPYVRFFCFPFLDSWCFMAWLLKVWFPRRRSPALVSSTEVPAHPDLLT